MIPQLNAKALASLDFATNAPKYSDSVDTTSTAAGPASTGSDSASQCEGLSEDGRDRVAGPTTSPPAHRWQLWLMPRSVPGRGCRDELVSLGGLDAAKDVPDKLRGLAARLCTGTTVALCSNGVLPRWDDPAHAFGGRLVFNGIEHSLLPSFFEAISILLLSNEFGFKGTVSCVTAHTRQRPRMNFVQIWTRRALAPYMVRRLTDLIMGALLPVGDEACKCVSVASFRNKDAMCRNHNRVTDDRHGCFLWSAKDQRGGCASHKTAIRRNLTHLIQQPHDIAKDNAKPSSQHRQNRRDRLDQTLARNLPPVSTPPHLDTSNFPSLPQTRCRTEVPSRLSSPWLPRGTQVASAPRDDLATTSTVEHGGGARHRESWGWAGRHNEEAVTATPAMDGVLWWGECVQADTIADKNVEAFDAFEAAMHDPRGATRLSLYSIGRGRRFILPSTAAFTSPLHSATSAPLIPPPVSWMPIFFDPPPAPAEAKATPAR